MDCRVRATDMNEGALRGDEEDGGFRAEKKEYASGEKEDDEDIAAGEDVE